VANTVAFERRDQENVFEIAFTAQLLDKRQEISALHAVDLVEREHRFALVRSERFDDRMRIACREALWVCRKFLSVGEEDDAVGLTGAGPGSIDHRAVEPPPRLENTWRIDEDDLCVTYERNAAHRHACCLYFGTDDRHLRADQSVDQSRLSRVSRSEPPSPVCAAYPLTDTSTRKRGAWSGPSRLMSE